MLSLSHLTLLYTLLLISC
ncbi:unnamed protein product [Linum tenue]|uniref:Uncharacterized protein n=1 Tax=Linum tenue TaxID=586396 RepID=A0AAV0QTC9_9ROSI|nr:unnamed protein product [Linum tenue]